MMKKIIHFALLFVFTLSFMGCGRHFISDSEYREQVIKDFEARKELAKGREAELFSVFDQKLTRGEKEALQFLYAYMPLSDLADYDGEFFLQQVRYAFKAREEFSWGKSVPEDIFRHFVLVYRVNNENLDTARMVFFHELKDRINDLSMYDAALEVNHWCHEKVTYRPADIRTSAPLATVRTSLGRCGEQSTFTVTALRAVGIPARQCYTPRWAHTDSNHAWVEVWINGKWYFLGACEPDPELNMGWFANPSTRAMMVHTTIFGKNNIQGEKNVETPLYSVSNMLDNYADVKKVTVHVLDQNEKPVEGATVKFKLYNYAEYYPLASISTNSEGIAQLTTGQGDLLVWISHDGKYNYQKIDVREQDEITIILNRVVGEEYVEQFDMVPPFEKKAAKEISDEVMKKHNARLQYEDSVRNAYMATYMKEEEARKIKSANLTEEQIVSAIKRSEGNHAEIAKFIKNHAEYESGLYLNSFLESLADKDLRDTPADILEAHVTYYKARGNVNYGEDVYLKGILPARIANELIRPWRPFLNKELKALFGEKVNSDEIYQWIKENVKISNEDNYYRCPISPRGVFELKVSDEQSRDIFFVAACRSMDIPAYLDGADGKIYVYENKMWKEITFESKKEKEIVEKGELVLSFNPDPEMPQIQLTYGTHFTLAQFVDGDFVTFSFRGDSRMNSFPTTITLDPGYYMLSTGNRYDDGTVLSRVEFFNIVAGEKVEKEVEVRKLIPRESNYGTVDLEQELCGSLEDTSIEKLMGDEKAVFCFIDPTREPTRHLLKDIGLFKKQYEEWGGALVFVVPSDKNTEDFNPETWNLPAQSHFLVDKDAEMMKRIIKNMQGDFKGEYPLLLILNQDGVIIFKSEGYRIGAGELILKLL